MATQLQVIDNFMPIDAFLKLQDVILSPHFPWFYIETVSLPPGSTEVKDSLAVETDGFNHVMYDRDWKVTSFSHEYFDVFFDELERRLGFTKEHLIRSRASMKSPKNGFTADNYNLPHVDYMTPHETIIFYMNDTDGDTRIFNEKYTPTGKDTGIKYDTFTTQSRVTPKANRLVWIDGLQYHTASNPIEGGRRVIVNINLKPL